MSMRSSFDIKLVSRVSELPVESWNEFSYGNIFHQAEFLKIMERSSIEDSKMHFLLVKRENNIVTTAVFTEFDLDLTLFLGENYILKKLKDTWGSFFKIKVLFCGTPISAGQHNLEILEDHKDLLPLVLRSMEDLAVEMGIKHLIIKELDGRYDSLFRRQLIRSSWFRGFSLPETTMYVMWPTYVAYLSSLRSSYRRQILKCMDLGGNELSKAGEYIDSRVSLKKPTEVDLEDVYAKYLSVMGRAKVKLEVLNMDFFESLHLELGSKLLYFCFEDDGCDKSYFLAVSSGETLYFLWTAREQSKGDRDYFVLLQALIKYAIDKSFKSIHMGQTSYYPKMRIGARIEPRYIYHKCTSVPIHTLLRASTHWIYPEPGIDQLEPFKKSI